MCDIIMTYEVLRALEKRGLLERSQKEGDARSKFSELTDAGAAKIQGAAKREQQKIYSRLKNHFL
jgi:DNA-binding MarR family transcriptional regulator